MSLVSLAAAKRHLFITDPAQDPAVIEKLAEASELILRHLDQRADPSWNESTAPFAVQAATKLMLGYLFAGNRGDSPRSTPIWQDIENVLKQMRDPALA